MSTQDTATVEQTAEKVEETPITAEAEVSPTPTTETNPSAESSEDAPSATSGEDEDADASTFSIHTLKSGQYFKGTVKNITDFGAFVDIGLPQDGLVHISELAKQKVEKVSDVVNVGDAVEVWVKKVDKKRGRISLTMIKPIALKLRDIAEGDELSGTVTRLESYGAFVDIGSERDGLVHISQITHEYIKHPEDVLKVGDTVQVKVLKVNPKKRQIDLSIKALLPIPVKEEIVEEEVIEEIVVEPRAAEEQVEEEPAPTALALALAAAMENRRQSGKSDKGSGRDKRKRKKEIDDIVSRTLATRE
jgi:transcriptional accessory protein Tex/SPT6